MDESYLVRIEDALDIPAAVYAMEERGKKEEIRVILDHQEPANVIRGVHEHSTTPPVDKAAYTDFTNQVVRRPDGGNSWYHEQGSTLCYMKAAPLTTRTSKGAAKVEDAKWRDHIVEDVLLHHDAAYAGEYTRTTHHHPEKDSVTHVQWTSPENDFIWHKSDIYHRALVDEEPIEPWKQVAGMSYRFYQDTIIARACFPSKQPETTEFEHLLELDGINPDTYYEAIRIPDHSVFDQLLYDLAPAETRGTDFITAKHRERADALQQKTGRRPPKSCVLSGRGLLPA